MAPFRLDRTLRALGATLALALFVLGTNLCMVSGAATARGVRVPMSCMAGDGPTVATHAGGAAPCCQHGPARTPRAPAPTVSPCCVSLIPVTAPAADHPAPTTAIALTVDPPSLPAPAGPAHAVAPDAHDPPGSRAHTPRAARAPPIL